jgi:hypothetical protein
LGYKFIYPLACLCDEAIKTILDDSPRSSASYKKITYLRGALKNKFTGICLMAVLVGKCASTTLPETFFHMLTFKADYGA